MKVAFQGERGAYSEAALLQHFGADVKPVGVNTDLLLERPVFAVAESYPLAERPKPAPER